MLAASAMNGAVLDSTYNFFFKLKYNKLFDQMLATPLTTTDIARGELSWSLLRGGIYSAVFLLVMVAMGLVHSWWAVLAVPAALLVGAAFGAVGMALTTYMRSWQDFDYVTLGQLPLFLFSATFFPLSAFPELARLGRRGHPAVPRGRARARADHRLDHLGVRRLGALPRRVHGPRSRDRRPPPRPPAAELMDEPGRLGWRRRVALGAVVVVAAVAVGGLLGVMLAGGTPDRPPSSVVRTLPPLAPGALVEVPDATPQRLDEPIGLGSLHAGVALLARSEVDQVRTADGRRRAPAGSRLLAFRVGDWTCEDQPCEGWRSLSPTVVVEGDSRNLPDRGSTFVVAVPPGSATVDLVVAADGFRQAIDLVAAEPRPDNIALLAQRDLERRVPLGASFTVAEHTSVPLDSGSGGRTEVFQRQVGVEYAQRRFFLHGAVPSSPRTAFLVVNAYYSYAGRSGRYILAPGEVAFVGDDGTRYEARDLDPSPDQGLLGFEVPATVVSGILEIGGSTDKVSTTGVPYVSTLEGRQLPIDVG